MLRLVVAGKTLRKLELTLNYGGVRVTTDEADFVGSARETAETVTILPGTGIAKGAV